MVRVARLARLTPLPRLRHARGHQNAPPERFFALLMPCSILALKKQKVPEPLIRNDFRTFLSGDPDENRTRVTAVKGRCLNRLTTGPYMVAAVGFEPTTYRV